MSSEKVCLKVGKNFAPVVRLKISQDVICAVSSVGDKP